MSFNSQSSSSFLAVASLLSLVEGLRFPKSDWCFYPSHDSALLEVSSEIYSLISGSPEFACFVSLGGVVSIEDGNPYLPELDFYIV